MATDRRVTGEALSRILSVGKEYIDSKDIWFEEVEIDPDTGITIDPDTGLVIEDLNFCKCDDLYAEDVQQILNRTFNNNKTIK